MNDITATLRVKSPDIALTETLAYDETATIQPVSGTGTVPNLSAYLFTVQTDDFERFETGLERDHTIDTFERVLELDTGAVYRCEYSSEAMVFSGAIDQVDGVSVDWVNDDTAWIARVWLPDREALATLWEYATDHGIAFSLERVSDYPIAGETDSIVTEPQREALLRALDMGYFEEPREATLSEVAADLGISQPAAGGLLRRGFKRLLLATVAAGDDDLKFER